jgi:hypothetical protein
LIFVVELDAAGGGTAGLVAVASRHPTQAQISAAGQREFAVLWQRLPAGKIFPASVGYVNSLGAETTATMVGVAPRARCAAAVDARAAAVLAAAGCLTMLRATYTDASRTALATIGIAVMRSADGADTGPALARGGRPWRAAAGQLPRDGRRPVHRQGARDGGRLRRWPVDQARAAHRRGKPRRDRNDRPGR